MLPILLLCLSFANIPCLADERKTTLCCREKIQGFPAPITLRANTYLQLIRQSDIFLDKSMLIKQLAENAWRSFIISRPRRWGKSINIDMLRMFFEMAIDKKGNEIPINERMDNYRLFVKGEFTLENGETDRLKNPPLISQHKSIVDQFMGQHPVIYLNFTNITGQDMGSVYEDMLSRITDAFEKHQYIIDKVRAKIKKGSMSQAQKKYLESDVDKIAMILKKNTTMDRKHVHTSIRLLCKLLFQHFKTRSFLFMDDFDAPINAVLTGSLINKRDIQHFRKFYTNLLRNSFVMNDYIQKGVITGVYYLWEEAETWPLKWMQIDNCIEGKNFSEFYGINSWEANLTFAHCKKPLEAINDVYIQYTGYEFAGFPLQVYNPWSIAKILSNEPPPESFHAENNTYWKSMSRFFKNMLVFPEIKDRLYAVFSWNYIAGDPKLTLYPPPTTILQWVDLTLLVQSCTTVYDPQKFTEMCSYFNKTDLAECVILFLLQQGFFTVEYCTHPDQKYYHIRIPTVEAKEFLTHPYDAIS